MPITLNGDTGIQTPMYNGTITANAVTPSVNMKNRIINGAMVIAQRGTTGNASAGGNFILDRFICYSSNTTPAVTQSSDAPTGFANSLLWTQSSAATRNSGDYYEIGHKIEGYNIADLNLGTANAKTFTVSFWVKSSVTGTYSFAIRNSSATYAAYVSTYTISVANTWQQVTSTITGATSGTWNITNGSGLEIYIDLGSGSASQTSTYNSWIYGNGSALASASQVGFAQTAGATFYITGVQLEVGSTATSFEYLDYGRSLFQCQRYFEIACSTGYNNGLACSNFNAADTYASVRFAVTKRATPVVTVASPANSWNLYGNGSLSYVVTAIQAQNVGNTSFQLRISTANQLNQGGASHLDFNTVTVANSGGWNASAEL